MSGQGHVLGATTTTATGIAALPYTGGHTILTYVTIAAIVLGSVILVLQLGVTLYRFSLRYR